VCRERCWRYDWAIDCDVQKFFGSVPWELIVKAAEAVTTGRRPLAAGAAMARRAHAAAGRHLGRAARGHPPGSPPPPVLASLFMHYAFGT
jgi:hypothetical protein